MKKNSDNRGMAFVTVLIAITFISLLASSLLFMAYLNYKTKALRFSATDNFYSDEYAVDEVSSSLQEAAAKKDTMDEGYEAIRIAAGVSDFTGSKTARGKGHYDPDAIKDLVQVSNIDGNAVVSCNSVIPDTEYNYFETNSSITLKGVQLTSTTDKGYYSSVTTDIIINFPSPEQGDYDVNDFSVISDSFITSATGVKGGSICFSGNMYLRKNGSNPAFKADAGRSVAILSDKAVFDGDMVISDGATTLVGGDLIVNGEVKVDSGCLLIVTGHMYCKKCSGSGKYIAGAKHYGGDKYYDNISALDASYTLPDDGLTTALYSKHLYICDENGTVRDYADESVTGANCFVKLLNTSGRRYSMTTDVTSKYTGEKYGTRICLEGTENGFKNQLVLHWDDVTIRQYANDSTILTKGKIIMDQLHKSPYTKMSDEGYLACKEKLLMNGASGLSYDFSPAKFKCATGTFDDFKNQIKKAKTDSSITVIEYNCEDGSKKTLNQTAIGKIDLDSLSVDDATRYLVYDSAHNNYIPTGYILAPDTKTIIAKYLSIGTDKGSPKNSSVTYANWSKD